MRKNAILLSMLLAVAWQVAIVPPLFPGEEVKPATKELGFNRAWAERAFGGTQTPLAPRNRLLLLHEERAGDTKKNLGSLGGKIRLGDKTYSRGIGVKSQSVLRVELTQPADRFRAEVGMDPTSDGTHTAIRFRVEVSGKTVFVSEFIKTPAAALALDIPLDGAQTFDLVVESPPDSEFPGRGNWADARVVLRDGSQLWLDELADQWETSTDFPFSFTLDGRPSREFLGKWKRDVKAEQLDRDRLRRTVTLQDPATGLEIRAVATIYTDTAGVDWTLYFTNRGSKDTPILENVKALDVTINPGVGTTPRLHRLRGSDAQVDDWQPLEDSIAPGQRIEFAPTGGRPSQKACPFFTVQYGGGGVVTAIGWSGQWSAQLERQPDGKLRLQAGMQNLHLRLHPGESIRSPRILQLYWFGDDCTRGHNLFRSTMLSHIVPRIDGAIVTPPIAHLTTSFYELNDSTESDVLSHLDSIKGLGFEMLWLDAYWTKDGFPNGMGHYGFPIERAEPPDRFPRGLKPIGDAAHREGMGFLVWFEPERVHFGTYLAREHPEWVVKVARGSGWELNRGLFNLGVPAAREYMTKYLEAVIKAYGLDCLRIDYNIDPGPFWKILDSPDPDRVGMAEIRYVEGLYKMWDDILQAFPHLYIDNCASGGRRIDLETSSRSLPLWRTDATGFPLMNLDFDQSALQNQLMTAGLDRYVPFSTSGQMGASPYWFRSGFNAGIAFGEDVRPAGYPRDQLKQAIAEGKRIRKYFFGNFYPPDELTTSAEDWCVMQFHRTANHDGMVLAFRRHLSPYGNYEFALHEIEPKAEYEVTFYPTYTPSKKTVIVGAELQRLRVEIADRPGSLLVEYKRINH